MIRFVFYPVLQWLGRPAAQKCRGWYSARSPSVKAEGLEAEAGEGSRRSWGGAGWWGRCWVGRLLGGEAAGWAGPAEGPPATPEGSGIAGGLVLPVGPLGFTLPRSLTKGWP